MFPIDPTPGSPADRINRAARSPHGDPLYAAAKSQLEDSRIASEARRGFDILVRQTMPAMDATDPRGE